MDLLKLAEAARIDPSLIPNHAGFVDRKIREKIVELDLFLKMNADCKGRDTLFDSGEFAAITSEKDALERALTAYTSPTPLEQAIRSWSPRYLDYCKAHGHPEDPEGMLKADRLRWPGGHMCGFILWCSSGCKKATSR